jgi:hypothetical protein
MTKPTVMPGNVKIVRTGIVEMLKAARCAVARNVNWHIRTTYREIGRQIGKFEELVKQPAVDLTRQPGRGFARRNLWQVRAFDRARPELQIRQTLSGESLTCIVSNNIKSTSSSTLRAIARSLAVLFPPRIAFQKEPRNAELLRDRSPRFGLACPAARTPGRQSVLRLTGTLTEKAARLQKVQTAQRDDASTPEEAIKDQFLLRETGIWPWYQFAASHRRGLILPSPE